MTEVQTYIQINTTCNQRCLFCNRPPDTSTKQVFNFNAIKKRLQVIARNPSVTRVIFTGGEPLLYPRLPEIIAWAKKLGFTTEIQTNGTLLHTKIFALKQAGLDIINFAFHSHKAGISQKLRSSKFNFRQIIKNLQQADKLKFQLHIIHVINSLNYRDLPEFIDFLHQLRLQPFWLNLSLVVPEGWAWENNWIVPRVKQVKPYLLQALKKCQNYNFKFDISEIVPLCLVPGFEEHAISTLFKISQLEIIDDYLTGKRRLNFNRPTADYASKAPQCQRCTLTHLCAGFYPRMKQLYGVADYLPRTDNPQPIYQKLLNHQ